MNIDTFIRVLRDKGRGKFVLTDDGFLRTIVKRRMAGRRVGDCPLSFLATVYGAKVRPCAIGASRDALKLTVGAAGRIWTGADGVGNEKLRGRMLRALGLTA